MFLEKRYVTNNKRYKNQKIIKVKGLVLHSVGCPQPAPDVFFKLWDDINNVYMAQIVIGANKAYECLPCTEVEGQAVHCAHVGTANGWTIGAEMTEPSTIKYTGGCNWIDLNPEKTKAHVMATYNNAVTVFAELCTFHKLDPLVDGVILSHRECNGRGIGTAHGDVEHLWNAFGLTMDGFRLAVKEKMKELGDDYMTGEEIYNALREYTATAKAPDWAKEEFQEAIDMGITDGKRPMELIPRYQAAIMAKRAAKKKDDNK